MNKTWMVALSLGLLTWITAQQLPAAPHPGMGSSALSDASKKHWLTNKSYHLIWPEGTWHFLANEKNMVRLASNQHPGLVFSIATLGPSAQLKATEFTNMGFSLLNQGNYPLKDQSAKYIDYVATEKKIQARQVLVPKGKMSLLFTCTSSPEKIQSHIKICDGIIQSLK